MDARSCRSCGRLFNYIQGPPICMACKQKLEDKFLQVRDYIRENDSATMKEISEDNEVSVKQIKQWVREERLTFTDHSPVGIECETCGKMIRTGRFCDKCKNSMASNLQAMYAMPVKQEESGSRSKGKDRMRFLDK
ncbi:MAG: flagellar protein [Eubacterium sp.]|nr:flagellar protein [Eubacterium sp.]